MLWIFCHKVTRNSQLKNVETCKILIHSKTITLPNRISLNARLLVTIMTCTLDAYFWTSFCTKICNSWDAYLRNFRLLGYHWIYQNQHRLITISLYNSWYIEVSLWLFFTKIYSKWFFIILTAILITVLWLHRLFLEIDERSIYNGTVVIKMSNMS